MRFQYHNIHEESNMLGFFCELIILLGFAVIGTIGGGLLAVKLGWIPGVEVSYKITKHKENT